MKKNPSLVQLGVQGNWSRAARQVIAAGALLLSLSSAIAQTAISTLAGSSPAIASGNVEGTGTVARFNALASVAVDSTGNIYVADANNHTIRKVTAAGVVSTLAGSGVAGSANGTGAAASFRFPQGVATDNTNGNSAYSLETKGRWYYTLSGTSPLPRPNILLRFLHWRRARSAQFAQLTSALISRAGRRRRWVRASRRGRRKGDCRCGYSPRARRPHRI